jgi:hypothetical protein
MSTNIHKALDTQLLTVDDLPEVQLENEELEASGIRPAWCRSTLLPIEVDVISFGSGGSLRNAGLYQVDLFYPGNEGKDAANEMADAVVAAFDRKTLQEGDTRVVTTKAWRDAARREKQFYVVPILVRYYSQS